MEIIAIILFIALTAYYMYGSYQSVRAAFNKHIKKVIRAAAFLRAAAAVLVALSVLIVLMVHLSDEVITYSYADGVISEHSSYGRFEALFTWLFAAGIAMMLISIPIECRIHRKGKEIARCAVVTVIMTLIMVLIGMVVVVGNYTDSMRDEYSPAFYRYESPIDGRSIVICERTRKGEGFGDIFQIKGSKAEKIASFTTEDHRCEGKYSFKWTASKVTVTYVYDPEAAEPHREIIAEFVDM